MKNKIIMFEDYLVNEKKSSANTRESYLRDVNQFASYCDRLNLKEVSLIDTAFLNDYLQFLTKAGKSEATKTRIIASIRCFFNFLLSKGVVLSNAAESIKFKKTEKKIPEVLDANQVILLLSQPDGDDYKSIRDKAMLELLYATGIKVSELLKLTVSEVNLTIGILHLHSGDKERVIPIYPNAVKSIAEYLVNVRPYIISDTTQDTLFTNFNGQPMSRQGFWKIIKYYAEKAGIKVDITPHTLRHSFAAHLIENGAKLQDIKEMLGHSDISSTRIYAKFMKTKYTQNYAKFHPLAKWWFL